MPTQGIPTKRSVAGKDKSKKSGKGKKQQCPCQGNVDTGGVSYSYGCSSGTGDKLCKFASGKKAVNRFKLKPNPQKWRSERIRNKYPGPTLQEQV